MYVAIAKNTSMTGQEITLGKKIQTHLVMIKIDNSRLWICDKVNARLNNVLSMGVAFVCRYSPLSGTSRSTQGDFQDHIAPTLMNNRQISKIRRASISILRLGKLQTAQTSEAIAPTDFHHPWVVQGHLRHQF